MPQIGPLEIVVILLVALVVFGPSRLPEVGKQAARGLREFKRFQSGIRSDLQGMLDSDDERKQRDADSDDESAGEPDDVAELPPPAPPAALEPGPSDAVAPTDTASSGNDLPPADASQ